MKLRHTFALTLTPFFVLFLTPAVAVEDIVINYSYEEAAQTDLSNMRVTLKISEFTDARNIDNPRLITDSDLAGVGTGFQAEKPIAAIISDALTQGFVKANAKLVDVDEDMSLQGSLLSTEAKIVDRQGVESIQLTMRTKVELKNGNRTIWQTTLFGRGTTPLSDGFNATVRAALDRTIRELIIDDYFLLEIR